MVTSAGFEFSGYQAAAFYVRLAIGVRSILTQVLGEVGEFLDGDPVSLPVPAEAPPEIPRVMLTSKDRSLRFDISVNRADFRWQRTESVLDLRRFLETAQRAFQTLNLAAESQPGRLALVAHRFKPQQDPGKALAEHFCRPELLENTPRHKGPLNRPEAFEMHAFKQFRLNQFTVNSWFRAKTGLVDTKNPRSVVMIEHDLNTPQEQLEQTRFSLDDIHEFHRLSSTELDTIMTLYFPPSPSAK
jgi:hypothetical protein